MENYKKLLSNNIFDMQRQFVLENQKEKKRFIFHAQTNQTCSYSISYFECEENEFNAWMSVSLAISKDYPHLIFKGNNKAEINETRISLPSEPLESTPKWKNCDCKLLCGYCTELQMDRDLTSKINAENQPLEACSGDETKFADIFLPLQKLKSVKLCLEAHPDNEPDSEFADRIDDLSELIDWVNNLRTASQQSKELNEAVELLRIEKQHLDEIPKQVMISNQRSRLADIDAFLSQFKQ